VCVVCVCVCVSLPLLLFIARQHSNADARHLYSNSVRRNFAKAFSARKIRMIGLPYAEERMMIC